MNFIPKSARTETAKFIEKATGKVSATYGTYDKKVLETEYGFPFTIGNASGGNYTYVQLEDSKSFYNHVVHRNKIFQTSFDIDLNERWRIEFGGMYQDQKLIQNPGWNRVTQDLIDNQTYITGGPSTIIPDTNGNGVLDEAEAVPFNLDKFCVSFSLCFGARVNTGLNVTGTTKLSPKNVFTDTIDFGDTEAYVAYFDVSTEIGENLEFKNQVFVDHVSHQKYTSYGFTNVFDATVIKDKVTLKHTLKSGESLQATSIFGGSLRRYFGDWSSSASQDMQIMDRRDLSVGATTQDRFAAGTTAGRTFNQVQDSEHDDLGLFFMSDIRMGENIGIIGGIRYDSFEAETINVVSGAVGTGSDEAFTFNLSGIYTLRLSDGWSFFPYLTYAESTFLEAAFADVLRSGPLNNNAFLAESDLWEGGVKVVGFEGRLNVAFDIYQQNRTRVDAETFAIINTRGTGYELEMRFAPNVHWAITATGTWQKSVETPPADGFGAVQFIPPRFVGLTPEEAYGGRALSGTDILGIKSFETDGQPDKVFSIYASYTGNIDEKNWGATFGSTYVASVFSGRLHHVKLPDYWVTNASAYIEFGKWRFSGNIYNLFDVLYFRSQDIFSDILVLPSAGTTADVTLSFSW